MRIKSSLLTLDLISMQLKENITKEAVIGIIDNVGKFSFKLDDLNSYFENESK